MADPFSVNKATQFGVESLSGTAVPANKLLPSMSVDFDPEFDTQKIRGSGRRFYSIVTPSGQEATTGKLGGGVTFTELIYPMSMIWGAASISTPSGASLARQHQWVVPLTGRVNPKSMTIEQGDSDDAERVTYGVLTSLGFELSRESTNLSGNLLAKAIQKALAGSDFESLTAAPTALALQPVLPSKWDVFMDFVAADIGQTQLDRAYKATMDYGGAFTPFYPMDSRVTSFAGIADGEDVAATGSLTLVKTSSNEALWVVARRGAPLYVRLQAKGDLIDNLRTVSVTGSPTGGSFTLTYGGVTSGAIAYNSTAAQLKTVLEAMSNIGVGNVDVTGATALPSGTLTVSLIGTQAQETGLFTLGANSLTGGTTPAPAFSSTQIPFSMQIDFAAKVAKPGGTDAIQGLRTRQWDLQIVEDANWSSGQALVVTMVNNLTSL